jgi:aquaporin Z
MELRKALTAEFIGTFALIYIGAGAGALGVGGLVGVALAHGLVIVAFAYAYGHHSGTHINPAVTFGMLVAGEISLADAIRYWVVQFTGATLAAFALSHALRGSGATGLGATTFDATSMTATRAILIEAVLTFFLVNTIMNTAVSGKAGKLAGLAIGLTLVFCILMGGPLTGASLNPARTFGPALVSGDLSQFWVYLVGTLLGATAAALLYRTVLREST